MKNLSSLISKGILVVTILFITSCASTSYVGLSHQITSSIDVLQMVWRFVLLL